VHEFTEAGWVPRNAIADTIGAAWGLAHYTRTPCLAPPDALEQVLRPLPTAALRLPADLVDTLAQLGIERVDSLLALPRREVPAPFGAIVLQRLDQALGRRQEVIVPQRLPVAIEAAQAFDYPTDRLDALTYVIDGLTSQIEQALQTRNCAARQVACWLYHLSEPPLCVQVGFYRPRQSPHYLGHLLSLHLHPAHLK